MQQDKPGDAGWNGLIMAGGRSRRMGRDKAMLDWEGRPLLSHMQHLLRQAGANEVVISGDYPGYGGIPDVHADEGPMSALAQMLPHLGDGTWVLVPVDMPRLSRSLLDVLLAAPAVCAALRDHPLPMVLRIDDMTRRIVHATGARPGRERSFRSLMDALPCRILDDAPWRDELVNCNTPEQWNALQAAAPARNVGG